jgi:hypothetical protein
MAMFGAGTASADALTGKTYSDAAAIVSGWNRTAVVETVNGSQLASDDCIVSSWRKWTTTDPAGKRLNQVLMNLNCNQGLAAPGKPGNSMASPEGRQRAKDNTMAALVAKNDKDCYQSDAAMNWCVALCNRTGLCSVGA